MVLLDVVVLGAVLPVVLATLPAPLAEGSSVALAVEVLVFAVDRFWVVVLAIVVPVVLLVVLPVDLPFAPDFAPDFALSRATA